MIKELVRVLIVVKTYPNPSVKYDELVSTAGFREDGSWITIYPVPYRDLNDKTQYAKYQWIELEVVKNPSDPRPESYKPVNPNEIQVLDFVPTHNTRWPIRRKLCLNNVYTNLKALIEASKHPALTSLAVFKPS